MYKKIPNKTIASIIERYEPSAEAAEILAPALTPQQAVELLTDAKLYFDTVQFLAHALPMVDGIYWASEAVSLRANEWDDTQLQAINSAKNWLQQPNETNRVRADQLAERVGLEAAPAWVAKAVYWSGTGSIVSPELPAVMPPPFLYGHAVAATIAITAAVPEWKDGDLGAEAFYLKVIEQGLSIANGAPLKIELLDIEGVG